MARLNLAVFMLPLLMLGALVPTAIPTVALAQDDDLDDLPDDFLQDGGGDVKVREAAPATEETESFDFGDDPDWDAPPPPVDVPDGLDEDGFEEDPMGDLPEEEEPNDAFFSEDPPDDFSRAASNADPLDADPPEGGVVGGIVNASKGPSGPTAPTLGLGLTTKGKAPLNDNYDASVVARDLDSVVVELPVLVASKPSDFVDTYWLVTEVMVGERKVAESRHLVTRASVADMGPTVVWSKSHVPVLQRTGSVELRLSQMGEDGSAQPLFTKTVAYEL